MILKKIYYGKINDFKEITVGENPRFEIVTDQNCENICILELTPTKEEQEKLDKIREELKKFKEKQK